VLTGSDLRRLATGIRLSRHCRRIIAINVGIGLGWTAVVVALAATTSMGPIWAVLLHHVGTLAVVTNAGRILSFDEPLTGV
jgi:cation transport ATPase